MGADMSHVFLFRQKLLFGASEAESACKGLMRDQFRDDNHFEIGVATKQFLLCLLNMAHVPDMASI